MWLINNPLNYICRFLQYLSNFPDVYIVSVADVFDWVRNPILVDDMDNFDNVQCDSGYPPSTCEEKVNCYYSQNLPIDSQEIYMNICSDGCPPSYPWVGNIEGTKKPWFDDLFTPIVPLGPNWQNCCKKLPKILISY